MGVGKGSQEKLEQWARPLGREAWLSSKSASLPTQVSTLNLIAVARTEQCTEISLSRSAFHVDLRACICTV